MTAPLTYPILEIDTDFGNGLVTGTFSFPGCTVEETTRTGYLVNSAFDDVLAVIQGLVDDGEATRKGFNVDAGGGQHVFEFDLKTWDGQSNQWGETNDETVENEKSATGSDRITKSQIFQNYLRKGVTDSFTPARLKYGQYHPDGVLEDHLNVAIENPSFVNDTEQASVLESSLTVVEIADLNQTLDGTKQTEG